MPHPHWRTYAFTAQTTQPQRNSPERRWNESEILSEARGGHCRQSECVAFEPTLSRACQDGCDVIQRQLPDGEPAAHWLRPGCEYFRSPALFIDDFSQIGSRAAHLEFRGLRLARICDGHGFWVFRQRPCDAEQQLRRSNKRGQGPYAHTQSERLAHRRGSMAWRSVTFQKDNAFLTGSSSRRLTT